jgi:branched-subunit amino acid transport protein
LNSATAVTWLLRFIPFFCLGKGLYAVIYIDALGYFEGSRLTAWSEPVLLVEVIFLAAEGVVYLALAICIDKWSTKPRMVSFWRKLIRSISCRCCTNRNRSIEDGIPAALAAAATDDDVLEEQDRVLSGRANTDLIVISDLTKVYDNGKVAVDHLSLGVPPGECFGLLGINGMSRSAILTSP